MNGIICIKLSSVVAPSRFSEQNSRKKDFRPCLRLVVYELLNLQVVKADRQPIELNMMLCYLSNNIMDGLFGGISCTFWTQLQRIILSLRVNQLILRIIAFYCLMLWTAICVFLWIMTESQKRTFAVLLKKSFCGAIVVLSCCNSFRRYCSLTK